MEDQRTHEIGQQAEEGDHSAVWQLAKTLRMQAKRPKRALAPMKSKDGTCASNQQEFGEIWLGTFIEDLFGASGAA